MGVAATAVAAELNGTNEVWPAAAAAAAKLSEAAAAYGCIRWDRKYWRYFPLNLSVAVFTAPVAPAPLTAPPPPTDADPPEAAPAVGVAE